MLAQDQVENIVAYLRVHHAIDISMTDNGYFLSKSSSGGAEGDIEAKPSAEPVRSRLVSQLIAAITDKKDGKAHYFLHCVLEKEHWLSIQIQWSSKGWDIFLFEPTNQFNCLKALEKIKAVFALEAINRFYYVPGGLQFNNDTCAAFAIDAIIQMHQTKTLWDSIDAEINEFSRKKVTWKTHYPDSDNKATSLSLETLPARFIRNLERVSHVEEIYRHKPKAKKEIVHTEQRTDYYCCRLFHRTYFVNKTLETYIQHDWVRTALSSNIVTANVAIRGVEKHLARLAEHTKQEKCTKPPFILG